MSDRMRELNTDLRSAVDFALREITHICRDMKKRAPGSEGEREAAAYMAASLEKDCGCDVKVETFKEHPTSFYSYFYYSATFDTLCAVSFFIRPWLSILFGCLALIFFLFHFVLYKKPIDPFYPEKESVNVTAVRKCSGEVRQRVFLNGHIDAAWEFPLNYRFGGVVFESLALWRRSAFSFTSRCPFLPSAARAAGCGSRRFAGSSSFRFLLPWRLPMIQSA